MRSHYQAADGQRWTAGQHDQVSAPQGCLPAIAEAIAAWPADQAGFVAVGLA
jgi:hypothetical protein